MARGYIVSYLIGSLGLLIPFLAAILMILGVPCLLLLIKALKKYLNS